MPLGRRCRVAGGRRSVGARMTRVRVDAGAGNLRRPWIGFWSASNFLSACPPQRWYRALGDADKRPGRFALGPRLFASAVLPAPGAGFAMSARFGR